MNALNGAKSVIKMATYFDLFQVNKFMFEDWRNKNVLISFNWSFLKKMAFVFTETD